MKFISTLFPKNKNEKDLKADQENIENLKDDQQIDLLTLANILNQIMSLEQIQGLCFNLEVNYDALPGNTKSMKTKALIDYYSRPPRDIADLLSHLSEIRPDIPWYNPQNYQRKSTSLSDITRLGQVISYCFSENELRNLCTDLGVNYEDFPAGSKQSYSRELILYFDRSPDGLDDLIKRCIELRPKAPWQNPDIINYQPYQPKQLAALVAHLIHYFDDDKIKELCKVLKVNYQYLPGTYEGGIPRELVLYLSRREQITNLLEICQEKQPEIDWFNIQISLDEDSTEEDFGAENVQQLREELNSTFSENQIRNLCFLLGIDFDNLSSESKAYELVNYMQRRRRIPELEKTMRRLSQ